MTFPTNIVSATPAKYRFKLVSGGKSIICDPEPLEWNAGELIMERDLDVGGVFTSYRSDSLTFCGNGADFLEFLYTNYELGAQCTFHAYWWKGSIRDYVEFPTSFDIDFNFYEKVYVGQFGIGVRVKAVSNSLQTKLGNRKDVDVDLTKLVSVGDVNISDFPSLKKNLYFEPTNISVFGHWYKAGNFDIPRRPGAISYIQVPLDISDMDYTEAQSVPYVTKILFLSGVKPFFKTALLDYTVDFSYTFIVEVTDKDDDFPWHLKLYETNSLNQYVGEHSLVEFGKVKGKFTFEGSSTVSVSQGNNLVLALVVQDIADIKGRIWSTDITINQQIANTEGKTTEGIPIYEAFQRLYQLILDDQYPFYSTKFGRAGIIYDEAGNQYASSNQLTYAHIQTGLNQRGLPNADENNPIAINHNDLFDTANAIWNLGYGFETIGGRLRLRIEEYAHFFEDVQVIDFSSRVNKYDIVSKVMPELVPSEIKSGFDNFEYKEVNGRGEPNTTSKRTTKINTSTKYEIVAPYQGDTMGILVNLSTPIDSKDIKSDDKIFIVKTQLYSDGWKPEKDENITIVANSLYGEDLLNRYFLPSRNVIRHGNRISSGLRLFPSSYLRFQKSDKAQNLETSGETYTIAENDDILISSLGSPLYKPMSHTVKVTPFDWSDLETIQANPYGYIKLSDTISGYLLSLKKTNGKAEAEISIIEKI